MLPEGIDVAVEVVDDPAGAEAVLGDAGVTRAILELDLGELAERQDGPLVLGNEGVGAVGDVLGRRLEDVADQLEREHALQAPASVHHRAVAGL